MSEEKQIGVLGLGLMGSSLCLALRANEFGGRIHAFARREETRDAAMKRGMVDAVFDSVPGLMKGTSLVVVCTPVQYLADYARECLAAAEPGTVVTDVGSTKGELEDAVAATPSKGVFIGSHPMCGSEKTGIDAGVADLYEGATVAITVEEEPDEQVTRLFRFWALAGGRPVFLSAAEHDRVVAASSHLPHLVAAMLVRSVGRDGASGTLSAFCASGFRDTTRVAGGSPEMWRGILESNAPAILEELKAFRGEADQWIRLLEDGHIDILENLLGEAARMRSELVDEA